MFVFAGWRSFRRRVSRLRRALLSFASPKESKQRKGDPGRRPATRGSLRYSVEAGSAELGATPLRQSSPFIRPNLRCSASHKGPEKRHGTTSSLLFQTLCGVGWLGARGFSPSRRQRRATEALAEKGRGLSEGRSPEFRSPRQRRVAQGTGAAGTDPRVAFFLATFSWPSKKKYARRQGGTQRLKKQKTRNPPSHGMTRKR